MRNEKFKEFRSVVQKAARKEKTDAFVEAHKTEAVIKRLQFFQIALQHKA